MSPQDDEPKSGKSETSSDSGHEGKTPEELVAELEAAQKRLQEEQDKAKDELRSGLDELGLDADELIDKLMDEGDEEQDDGKGD